MGQITQQMRDTFSLFEARRERNSKSRTSEDRGEEAENSEARID